MANDSKRINKGPRVQGKGGASSHRTETEKAAHRAQIIEWRVTKPMMTTSEMAAALGVHYNTVRGDLKAILAEWREQRLQAVDDYAQRVVLNAEKAQHEAWAAWQRSQQPKEVTKAHEVKKNKHATAKVEVVGGADDGKQKDVTSTFPVESSTRTEMVREQRIGDPRFLDVVLKSNQQLTDLLGLAAPTKLEVSGQLAVDVEIDVQAIAEPNWLGDFVEALARVTTGQVADHA